MEKWTQAEFLRNVVEKGGFEREKIEIVKGEVFVTTCEMVRYATMLWSFIGGTSSVGWVESDEENWDEAVGVVMDELRKTDGFEPLDGGRIQLRFVANIVIARK